MNKQDIQMIRTTIQAAIDKDYNALRALSEQRGDSFATAYNLIKAAAAITEAASEAATQACYDKPLSDGSWNYIDGKLDIAEGAIERAKGDCSNGAI